MKHNLKFIYTNYGVYRLVWEFRYANHDLISEPIAGFPDDAREEIEEIKTWNHLEVRKLHNWTKYI